MDLGRYRLLMPLGAGKDGVAYSGEALGTEPPRQRVEVRVLLTNRDAPRRWRSLFPLLRRALLFRHPRARPLLDLMLEHQPPYLVLESSTGQAMTEFLCQAQARPLEQVLELGEQMAEVLLEAHRFGLAPALLGPQSFHGNPTNWKLELTGLDVQGDLPFELGRTLAQACQPPEEEGPGHLATAMAGNIHSLGVLLHWLLTGASLSGLPEGRAGEEGEAPEAALVALLQEMIALDPAERPLIGEVRDRLRALRRPPRLDTQPRVPASERQTRHAPEGVFPPRAGAIPATLGRFRLLEKLGQGGMGTVFRAEDRSDGRIVALKLLQPEWADRPEQLRRFFKEARVQAEIQNPNIINLLEINEDQGYHYLVLEFVAGTTLADVLENRHKLPEREALAIILEAARGLAHVHQLGIVHRDIKPENILLLNDPSTPVPRVKVSDFGLARHVVETESLNFTRPGAVLGTPWYMAPEQAEGKPVDARSDVYALGATLFHLLVGHPPYNATNPMVVLDMHRTAPVPSLRTLNPELSEEICHIVEKTLAKDPAERHANAGELFDDLERLLRGIPTQLSLHPHRPESDPARVLTFRWRWELAASPEQLWPHVANTERLNRAIGLQPVRWTVHHSDPAEATESTVQRRGQMSRLGLSFEWHEHPFEWVEGSRFGVLREFTRGPFRWLLSDVELIPRAEGGTTLHHRIELEPRHLLGRWLARLEIGHRIVDNLDRVYRHMDATLSNPAPPGLPRDPFEQPAARGEGPLHRLRERLQKLSRRGVAPPVVERLGAYLLAASPQELARIRPLPLARRLGVEADAFLAACLHGVHEGLLTHFWQVLCPLCRQPGEKRDSLRGIPVRTRCEMCAFDFEVELARSLEVVFRIHPEVGLCDEGSYCVGCPVHFPQVVAQVRLAPGEQLQLELALAEGEYRLCGPQLAGPFFFRVDEEGWQRRWDVNLSAAPASEEQRVLAARGQRLLLWHKSNTALMVRIERMDAPEEMLTGARVSALALFREFFPQETPAPGRFLPTGVLTFLTTGLEEGEHLYQDLGDPGALAILGKVRSMTADQVRREGGAVVRALGEGVLAVFADPRAAVRVALGLQTCLKEQTRTRQLLIKVGVHQGSSLAILRDGVLDYFGAAIHLVEQLPRMIGGGEVVLTQSMVAEPEVSELLRARSLTSTILEGGNLEEILHCFTLPTPEDPRDP